MNARILTMTMTLALALAMSPGVAGAASAASPPPAVGDPVSLQGRIQVIWSDGPPGSDVVPGQRYELVTAAGDRWRLALTPAQVQAAGGLLALAGARATVAGTVARSAARKVTVASIVRDEAASAATRDVFGSQRYIWILMRFGDNPDTPQPTYFFMDQALGDYPSLDHYVREISYNNVNLEGSIVLGWFDLPHPRSYYVYDIDPEDPDDEVDGQRTLEDAIALVDPLVDFTDYAGFHMCYNDVLDCCSYGGQVWLTLDGESRYWNVTWLADWGWSNQDVIAHETGHSLGWPHSSGPYGDIYDSDWDVMSHACGSCNWTDPVYGNLAVNTIAYHKGLAGWIHPLHEYEFSSTPEVRTLWLNHLAVVPPAGRLLTARIRWSTDWNRFYTFERRNLWGYDQNLHDATVIVHSVNPFREEPAHVVDPDANGDCNDEGARWDTGETFWDATNHVVATVEAADATGSLLTLCNAPLATVYVNLNNAGSEDGTANHPWDTFHEGYGAAYPTGTVYVTPGTYTAPLALRKNATIRRWGTSGAVTIGH